MAPPKRIFDDPLATDPMTAVLKLIVPLAREVQRYNDLHGTVSADSGAVTAALPAVEEILTGLTVADT